MLFSQGVDGLHRVLNKKSRPVGRLFSVKPSLTRGSGEEREGESQRVIDEVIDHLLRTLLLISSGLSRLQCWRQDWFCVAVGLSAVVKLSVRCLG